MADDTVFTARRVPTTEPARRPAAAGAVRDGRTVEAVAVGTMRSSFEAYVLCWKHRPITREGPP